MGLLYDKVLYKGSEGNYRLKEEYTIDGETDVIFTSPFYGNKYEVVILEYISTEGTIILYGWTITNKLKNKFTFTPPTIYPTGVLTYLAKYYK